MKVAERRHLPLGSASHTVAGSNPISSDQRGFRAALQDRQFVVRQVADAELLMNTDHSHGVPMGFLRDLCDRARISASSAEVGRPNCWPKTGQTVMINCRVAASARVGNLPGA